MRDFLGGAGDFTATAKNAAISFFRADEGMAPGARVEIYAGTGRYEKGLMGQVKVFRGCAGIRFSFFCV